MGGLFFLQLPSAKALTSEATDALYTQYPIATLYYHPQGQIITKYDAIAFILDYIGQFKQAAASLSTDQRTQVLAHACGLAMVTCEQRGSSLLIDQGALDKLSQPITKVAFLKILYDTLYHDPTYLSKKYGDAEEWFVPYVREAYGTGVIQDINDLSTLNKSTVETIFYRLAVLDKYKGIVANYFDGLVLDASEITPYHYGDVKRLEKIISHYYELLDTAKKGGLHGTYDTKLTDLDMKSQKFYETYQEVMANPLFYQIDVYPDAIREKMRLNGVKEIVGEGIYNFSTSPSYRKFNIRKVLDKLNGVVLQPDEEFNFWQYEGDKQLRDFQNGWIIQGGAEVWAVGGGICGGATTVFRGAFMAGLEITERRPHSIYYRGLNGPKELGFDATVAYRNPNLRFKNNTGAPIMFYTLYDDKGTTAHFQVLGTKPFKKLTLDGPHYKGRSAWIKRTIEYDDGTTKEERIDSTYNQVK